MGERQIDQYALARRALLKLAGHASVDVDFLATGLTYLDAQRRSRGVSLVDSQSKTIKPVEPSNLVDLGMSVGELNALAEILPRAYSASDMDFDQLGEVTRILDEQRELIINQPPTLLQKLRGLDGGYIKRAAIVTTAATALIGPAVVGLGGLVLGRPEFADFAKNAYLIEAAGVMGVIGTVAVSEVFRAIWEDYVAQKPD